MTALYAGLAAGCAFIAGLAAMFAHLTEYKSQYINAVAMLLIAAMCVVWTVTA